MALIGIDADLVKYRAAFAAEHMYYNLHAGDHLPLEDTLIERFSSSREMKAWVKASGHPESDFLIVKDKVVGSVETAKGIADSLMWKIFKQTGGSEQVSFFSPSKVFRHDLATTTPYKVRLNAKPEHYKAVSDYLRDRYNVITKEGLEADDCLAEVAESCRLSGRAFILASYDKDLDQIPGIHYDFAKERMYQVSPLQASRFFFQQVLTGDATDCIPGLSKVGPKNPLVKFINTLEDTKDMVSHVKKAYEARAGDFLVPWQDYLHEQANLIYIRSNPNEGVDFT